MFLVIKLLLIEVLLFNLDEALTIQNQMEKTQPQSTLETFEPTWDLSHNESNTSIQQETFDGPKNYQTTTPSFLHEHYDVVEFSPDTESYNNTSTSLDVSLGNTEKSSETNSSADSYFLPERTSNPDEFPWNDTSNKREGAVDQEAFQTKGIIDYNRTTLPKCPNGFIYHEGNESKVWICYFITEPTSFPPQCPFQNIRYVSWEIDGTDQKYWSFIHNNNTKECFVRDKTTEVNIIPANCSDKYPGVCGYTYQMDSNDQVSTDPAFTDYCKRRYNASCISNYMSSPFSCYCAAVSEREKPPRTAFCRKLVEITDPHKNHLLVKLLGSHERCWIGLHNLQWPSTNSTTNYTFWSPNTDFNKTYGVLEANGWSLEEDGSLNCAMCEVEDEDPPLVHLHIAHNKTTNTLDIEIKNATGASGNITCFAQNSADYQIISLDNYNWTDYLVVKQHFLFGTSGYYWCEALQMPELTTVYSNTVFIPSIDGHEYTLLVTLPQQDLRNSELNATSTCNNTMYDNSIYVSRLIKIIKNENQTLALCHIKIKPSKVSRKVEMDMLSNLLKTSNDKITNLASIEVCLPSLSISGGQTLHWPETPFGVTTIPEELCLQEDGSPVTRTCAGDFYHGGRWLDVDGVCANVTYSKRTYLLDSLLKSNTTTQSALTTEILNITNYTDNFTSFEIHLVSKILEKLVSFGEHINVSAIAKTINNIMHINSNRLRASQNTLNSTDMILCSLDDMLALTKIDNSGYVSEVTEKLAVQISDLRKTNVVGISVGKTQNGFDPSKVNPLQRGSSLDDLLKGVFDIAVIISEQLHQDILNCMGGKAAPNLITSVFYDDVLFNEQTNTTNHPDGRIVSVSIPNFDCTFTTPLQVIFNPSTSNSTQLKCASWDYGSNDARESTRGQWFMEGNPKTVGTSSYQICEFTHITHFTLLILGGKNEISEGHKKALDIITAVGSGLSILGLLMVFLTAIVFKSFRSANAVVINFSIAMTAQIVLLFIADNVAENKVLCTLFGAALHYIVLSQFCWMLTIAILQYRRYVVVFSTPTPYLVAKTCACSWGIPLIPIIIIIAISRDSYGENSYGLCYALGNYFIFGVLIPVSLIIFINLIVFLRIMLSIASSRRITVHQKKDDTSTLQLRLAVMLYFLLGLTWGFGLLAAIGGGIVYSYLFCITATLQGFILFLYFIVLNEKTRSLWTNMKTCHCKGKSDEYDVNTDSAAAAMMRRPRNTASSDTNTSSTTSEMLRRIRNRSSSDF